MPRVPVELTWLGQASFRVEAAGAAFAVDPWYSPHELRLAPVQPLELVDGLDAVLFTHEHLDHLDEPFLPTLRERSPGAFLAGPPCVVDTIRRALPGADVRGVAPGESFAIGGLQVDVVASYHGVSMEDAYGDGSSLGEGVRFLGFLVEADGATLYFAGDTLVTAELDAALRGRRIDVALLPVNGRDAYRERAGIVGNLDAREAVELALALGARTLVPYHWDGFAGNTVPPGRVADEAAARLHVVVPARGRPLRLA